MESFTIDALAEELQTAMQGAQDPQAAVERRLQVAVARFGAETIIAALEGAVPQGASVGELIVHQSAELTILYGRIPPNFQSAIHDHTVFACIAQLTGEERSVVYEPTEGGEGLRVARTEVGRPGDVTCLAADAIHHIENPGDEVAAALHVYGGNFSAVREHRSLWTHDHVRTEFTFEKLLHHSVVAMKHAGNSRGLDSLVEAIPAAKALVQST